MTLWLIFAAMTAAAVLALLRPLGRKLPALTGGNDRMVYQDQLAEIERDRAAGLIGEAEAQSARVEISRRLLAAADADAALAPTAAGAAWRRQVAAIATIVVLPAVALGFYLKLGSPDVPDQPAFARSATPLDHQSVATLVRQVEEHLASNPDDGAGWEILAPVYLRMGRFDDAVNARRKALALNGDTAARQSDLGEALVAAANGVVTDEAKLAFQSAIAADPHEAKARYFLGLADEQDGNRQGAAARWGALLAEDPNASWATFVRAALARVTGTAIASNDPTGPSGPGDSTGPGGPSSPGGPSAADVAAADTMSDAQRSQMIRGMVQRLSDQLHAPEGGSDDIAGWMRLVRAYVVLGDRAKARDAAADARRALASHPAEVNQIDELVKGLGLEG